MPAFARFIAAVICCGCAMKAADHGLVDVSSTTPCVTCHLADYQGTSNPPHQAMGFPTTCAGCHSTANWQAASGQDTSDPARDVAIDALIPSYAGTSILGLSVRHEILRMPMSHSSPDVDAAALSRCSTCHAGTASGMYFPGVLHASIATQPTRCSSCHTRTASMPSGFVGPLATRPARSPPSGEMKHDAVLWDHGAPTTTPLVAEDCGTCHATPSWKTDRAGHAPAAYHAALTAQPASCLDCHANSRPTDLLTAGNAALPANVQLDHTAAETLGDCVSCHDGTASWSGARYHGPASPAPTTCLPCHAGERPTTTSGWTSATYTASPFDYVTNSIGITHGAGQDCVTCHAGSTQTWAGGTFVHGVETIAGTTCIACHASQRPDLQPGTTSAAMAALLGFDHTANGSGDCFGCHQVTVSAGRYASYFKPGTSMLPGGDWQGAKSYPGSTLVSSGIGTLMLTELNLTRGGPGALVTGMTSITATLTSGMLHTASGLPAAIDPGPADSPNDMVCWHCHTSSGTMVTAYASGKFHASLAGFSATPGGPVTPLAQPTSDCTQCHAQVRPVGIVERAASSLQPMDHFARFAAPATIGGATVSTVAELDCSTCHHLTDRWDDGQFHARIGAASPEDCTACHYPGMADGPRADVTSGVDFSMRHRSGQITFQGCQTCHQGALANATATPIAATLWQPGTYHANLSSQPTACLDCHAVTKPATATRSATTYAFALGGTSSNGPQWMSHASSYVDGLDCVVCHAADAGRTGSAWTNTTSFHAGTPSVTSCQGCHGLSNGGGSTPGTNNNLPATLTDSSTVTTASADTGVPAGTLDQIAHTDINVSSHDCGFCHTQVGVATAPPARGKEWAQASFHASFTSGAPLVINLTTGRCSNCHMNVKPGPSFSFDHGAFTATSASDCSSCHSFPGTGTASAPNWLGAAGAPATINVGGFAIPQPPAPSPATQAAISNLPHPASAGGTCTTCHASSGGGRQAIGYDHLSSLIAMKCNACHEAGTNLIGTTWNGATTQSAGAGDSRPFTLTSVRATYHGDSSNETQPNHFYPVDCGQCHNVPAGNGLVTTGAAYQSAWAFPHNTRNMSNPTTCVMCHRNGIPD